MRRLIITSSLLLFALPQIFGCASFTHQKRNAELIVHYNGQEVSRSGSKYMGFPEFEKFAKEKGKKYIVFSARWCDSCNFLDRALKQSGHDSTVVQLDADEIWVQQLMKVAGLRNVPTMMVTDENGNFKNTLVGPSKIIMHLIVHGP